MNLNPWTVLPRNILSLGCPPWTFLRKAWRRRAYWCPRCRNSPPAEWEFAKSIRALDQAVSVTWHQKRAPRIETVMQIQRPEMRILQEQESARTSPRCDPRTTGPFELAAQNW